MNRTLPGLLLWAALAGCPPPSKSLQPTTGEVPTPEAPPIDEPPPVVEAAPPTRAQRPAAPRPSQAHAPAPREPGAVTGSILVVSTAFAEVSFRGAEVALPAAFDDVPTGRHEIRAREAGEPWSALSMDVTIQPDANQTVVVIEP